MTPFSGHFQQTIQSERKSPKVAWFILRNVVTFGRGKNFDNINRVREYYVFFSSRPHHKEGPICYSYKLNKNLLRGYIIL